MADSRKSTTTQAVEPNNQEKISIRAYELWVERGCPVGSPEIDWLRAEAEVTAAESSAYGQSRKFAA
ncbi:MAG TPA: DUF2934 domain-containing protein [Bryobacteraceae bacterium]|jgi:hypothetical protein